MATREAETGGEQPGAERKMLGRRRLLAALAAGGGGTLLTTQQWAKPIVDLVVVPLHAQASGPPCAESPGATCDGITFIASAFFTAGVECQGGANFGPCCPTVVWAKPANGNHRATMSISHNFGEPLTVKIDYFTRNDTGCTSVGSYAEVVIPNGAPAEITDKDVQGNVPECVGFRINEVKVTATGEEKVGCKGGPCNSGLLSIQWDLGIYATIRAQGDCPV